MAAKPAAPSAPKETSFTLFQYKINNQNTVTVTKYTGQEQNVVIPRTIGGKAVTHIGDWAFRGCKSLMAVDILGSAVHIGNQTFSGCQRLTIYGYRYSDAKRYAGRNHIPFSCF